MSKKVLIIYAHPEPSSLTRQLVDVSVECLTAQGHDVLQSDLYAMGWKAIFDENDFPQRANPQRLSFGAESAHAYRHRRQSPDVAAEQDKVLAADVVIFQFPLWWYGMPAIMKGWIDRVWAAGLAHGYKDAGNAYRYGDGAFKGKRAMLSVAVGGPQKTTRRAASTDHLSNCYFRSRTARSTFLGSMCCRRSPYTAPAT